MCFDRVRKLLIRTTLGKTYVCVTFNELKLFPFARTIVLFFSSPSLVAVIVLRFWEALSISEAIVAMYFVLGNWYLKHSHETEFLLATSSRHTSVGLYKCEFNLMELFVILVNILKRNSAKAIILFVANSFIFFTAVTVHFRSLCSVLYPFEAHISFFEWNKKSLLYKRHSTKFLWSSDAVVETTRKY